MLQKKSELVFEAGAATMGLLKGAYSCICMVKGVGLLAFRDPHGIRCGGWLECCIPALIASPSRNLCLPSMH